MGTRKTASRSISKRRGLKLVADVAASAKTAGLRYICDTGPGIRRVNKGSGFSYVGPDGKTVRDTAMLKRIRTLVIPPAWQDVWICLDPDGHVQAVGRDAKGRKQYRYHARWRQMRDETKYDRLLAFGRLLPRIRRRVAKDLAAPNLSRDKILATVVRLLETTLIRVGNEEYARANDSFGLTTMRDRHVKVNGATVRFEFRGKSGITHAVDLTDRRLARIVKQSRDLPGYELFQYIDEQGARRSIDSSDVNAYLRQVAGEEFTAKDFRTWAGTVLAAAALQEFPPYESAAQAKRNVVAAVEAVAKRLGNTKAICRKCYIHPDIIDAYMDGALAGRLRQRVSRVQAHAGGRLPLEEAAVLACLQSRVRTDSRRPHHSQAG
ncbi:DNA topoisomerase IB [Nitrospira sp. Nam80]